MILLNDFYTLFQHDVAPGSVRAKISINKTHKIFEGHFPGLPIVPGVCMMQIIREIMETTTKKSLKLTAADNVTVLIPNQTAVIATRAKRNVPLEVEPREITPRYVACIIQMERLYRN